MISPCFPKQRQRLTVRKSNGRKFVLSATSLSVVLFTIFLLSMCINWWHFQDVKIPVSEYNSQDNNGDVEFPSKTISITTTNNGRSKSVEGANRLNGTIHLGKGRNFTNSIDVLEEIERKWKKWKLSETEEHLARLSLSSKVDAEDLGMYLANKSAVVYRPGSWDGAGIVVEEFKLVFFTQGKVACTVFKQLFRRMMHHENWKVDSAHIPHNPQKNGLKYLYHYSVADALTILTHPNWTRAIFVRDPKERTLSAFLDKAARKNGKYVKRHCCNLKNATCGEEANASFLGFLKVIGERCCCDPHWKEQSRRIDRPFMPFINFVGHFDRIQVDTKRLLKNLHSKSDPWTEFGASGWGPNANESIFSKDTKAKHQTSALTKLREYYNRTSEALVEKLFAADYNDPILNFTAFSLFDEQ